MIEDWEFTPASLLDELIDSDNAIKQRLENLRHRENSKLVKM